MYSTFGFDVGVELCGDRLQGESLGMTVQICEGQFSVNGLYSHDCQDLSRDVTIGCIEICDALLQTESDDDPTEYEDVVEKDFACDRLFDCDVV